MNELIFKSSFGKNTLSFGISSRMGYPDFATVESDREQVNLTRFELNLPEKRNFFLEGNDIYRQRIQLFYSRRIADIYGGTKVYGKKARSEFAVLSAQTKEGESGEDSANFTVFRLKQDAIPGRIMKGWFEPTEAGEWDIQCAEMCGIGHGIMGARIVVETPEEHAAWVSQGSSGKLAAR